jgi:hypothetical protein
MISVRSPLGVIPEYEGAPVNPIPPLEGSTIVVLDNSKHNFRALMDLVRASIDEIVPDVNWQYERKGGAFRPMGEDIRARTTANAALVLTGSADCGCTSWSCSDAAKLEKAGIPVVLFATTPFMALARQLTRAEGIDNARIIEVAHPIGGLQPSELDERAADIIDSVKKILVGL